MQATLIANPAARLVKNVVSLDNVVRCLEDSGLELEVHQTNEPGDARRFAAEAVAAGVPRVIAAGGDGTINEVIQSLAATGTELAIVPLGTGNVIARYAGLDDRNYAASCDVAAAGRVVAIDLGLMDKRYFLAVAGVGIDAQVTLNLDPWWKQRVGKIAFVTEFFRSMLMQEPSVFRVTVDDQTIEGPMWGVLICNTNEYTWRLRPAPDVREDDGLLDIVFIHRQGFLDFLDLAARMFLSGETAAGHPTATVIRAGSMHIESNPSLPWQVDGDPLGMTPVSVSVLPKGLKLVVSG